MVICVRPSDDDEVIDEMPAMVENCRSIGDATEAAIVSGLAPGKFAVIWMVGKSTAGKRRHRQQPVAENAEHNQRRRDQRRHHRAADAGFRNIHGSATRDLGAADVDAWCRSTAELAVGDDGFAAVETRSDHAFGPDLRSTLTG